MYPTRLALCYATRCLPTLAWLTVATMKTVAKYPQQEWCGTQITCSSIASRSVVYPSGRVPSIYSYPYACLSGVVLLYVYTDYWSTLIALPPVPENERLMPFTFDSAPLHSSLTVAVASHARHRVLFRSPALACIRRRTLVAASRIIISSPTHIDPESLTIAYCLTSSPHCPRTSITPYPPSVHHIAIFSRLLPSTPSGALSTFPLCELYDNVRFQMAVRRTSCRHHTTRLLSCSSVRSHMHSPRTRIYTHTRLVSRHDYILLAAIGFFFTQCLASSLSCQCLTQYSVLLYE